MIFTAGVAFFVSLKVPLKVLLPIKLLILFSVVLDLTFVIPYHLFDYFVPHTGKIYRLFEWILLLEFFRIALKAKLNVEVFRIAQLVGGLVMVMIFPTIVLRVVNCILFSFLSVTFLFNMIKELKYDKATQSPGFWIISAMLIYFSGTIFLFLLIEPLGKLDDVSATITYAFHNSLGVFKNLLFAIGFKVAHDKVSFSL